MKIMQKKDLKNINRVRVKLNKIYSKNNFLAANKLLPIIRIVFRNEPLHGF